MLTAAPKGETMDHPALTDRRNAGTPQRVYTLENGAVSWQAPSDGTTGHMPLGTIRQVRLAVEMAGQDSQVVCRIRDADNHEIAFGSMRWAGIGQWEANARDFRAFLRALHIELDAQPGPIRYVEGSSLAFLAIMAGLGALMTLIAGLFFAKLFLIDENPIGLVLIPAMALGLWLTRIFWPRGAKPYDPAMYMTAAEDEISSQQRPDEVGLAENEDSVSPR